MYEHIKKRIAAAEQCVEHNDLSGAISRYKEIIKNWPDLAIAYNNLGVIYEKTGDWETAVEQYEKAVSFPHSLPTYEENLINAYINLNAFESAINASKAAVSAGFESPTIHFLAVIANLNMNSFAGAIPHLEAIVENKTTFSPMVIYDLNLSLLECYILTERHGEGLRRLGQTLADFDHPSEKRAFKTASLLAQEGLIRYAWTILQKNTALSVDSLELKNILAEQWAHIKALLVELENSDEEKRLRIINELIHYYDRDITNELITFRSDKSPMVRESVIEYFDRWGITRLDPEHHLLFDEVDYVRARYVKYLQIADPVSIRVPLKKALAGEVEPNVKAQLEELWSKNNKEMHTIERLSSFVESMKHVEGSQHIITSKLQSSLNLKNAISSDKNADITKKKTTPVMPPYNPNYVVGLAMIILALLALAAVLRFTDTISDLWFIISLVLIGAASYLPWHYIARKTKKSD